MEKIDAVQLTGMIPVSFDVVSLYTNVDTEEAITTTLEYIMKYKLNCFGLKTGDIWVLLHTLLDNNVFAYEDVGYFKQVRGLAMGNRVSGTLAILAMDKFERIFVYQELLPLVYVRYVDDVGTVVKNRQEAENTLDYLNSKHPTIKFEMELPSEEGFLPLLDMAVRIDETGHFQRKLFTKKASKGIVLNFASHQPASVKRALVKTEIQRANSISTDEHKKEALEKMTTKLQNNSYPRDWIMHSLPPDHRKRGRPAKASEKPDLTLRLPFISDEFNRGAKQLLEKHNITARLINQRGTTLSDLTKKRRRAGSGECQSKLCRSPEICRKSHVVYLATCDLCGNRYVGMTVRQLHAQALEHVRAATQHQEHTAFGDHYRTRRKKKKEPKLSFKILSQNHDDLRLHIEEALAIKTLTPELNKRQEEEWELAFSLELPSL